MDEFAMAESLNDLKTRLDTHVRNLDIKIVTTAKHKQTLLERHDKLRNEIEEHFNDFIENALNKKRCLLEERLRDQYDQVETELTTAINEANEAKGRIEKEVNNLNVDLFASKQTTTTTTASAKKPTTIHENDDILDYDEDDALMIQDTDDQGLDANNNTISTRTAKLEDLMKERLQIESIDKKIKGFLSKEFVKCKLDLHENCFGHIQSPNRLDHTHFIIENGISDSNVYVKNELAAIRLSCPCDYDRDVNIHNTLDIELFDQKGNTVLFDIKERFSNLKRYIKITFTPETYGIFKLNVKYDNSFIQNCPYFFNVLKDSPAAQRIQIKAEPEDVVNLTDQNNNVNKSNSNSTISNSNEVLTNNRSNLSLGRGRVMKQFFSEHQRIAPPLMNGNFELHKNGISTADLPNRQNSSNGNIYQAQSQKRKTSLPSETSQVDVEMRDVSAKSKRVNYNQRSSAHQHASVDETQPGARADYSNMPLYTVDMHLTKYSTVKFGELPNLKAKFECKYSYDLNFPIGVTTYTPCNWLIVADSGNHCVKVFNKLTGEYLRGLGTGVENGSVYFKRPSALYTDMNDAELYVKDDKEIQVFDLTDDFKLVRKFGAGILSRPYGLATDTKGNLVVVDANIHKPLVHVFNKNGNLLSSTVYQPVIKNLANNMNYPNLSKQTLPFDRTKIRFTYAQDNCLYASDLGRSIVYKTTLEGEILNAFGMFGKHKGEFNEPSGVFVDQNGGILLGDSKNDRLQVYDNQGKYKCDVELLDERIRRPSDLHVDKDGHIYITCFLDHCIKKYKLIES